MSALKRWGFLVMLSLALALSGCGAGEVENDNDTEQVLPGEGGEGLEGEGDD